METSTDRILQSEADWDAAGHQLASGAGQHLLTEYDSEPLAEVAGAPAGRFAIHLADSRGRRNEASYLIHRMYGWRGYRAGPMPDDPNRLTLVASSADQAVATVTVGLDSPAGMSAETLYPEELAALRASGARLCEFTRFAVDRVDHSLELLAAMFHVAYLYARRLYHATHLLAEVNPRHVLFYRRMLGFSVHGAERHCPRVDAPAVLLMLPLDFGEAQVARFGGQPELARTTRSLYPLFFSPQQEAGIVARLLADFG